MIDGLLVKDINFIVSVNDYVINGLCGLLFKYIFCSKFEEVIMDFVFKLIIYL